MANPGCRAGQRNALQPATIAAIRRPQIAPPSSTAAISPGDVGAEGADADAEGDADAVGAPETEGSSEADGPAGAADGTPATGAADGTADAA